jgi:hypothetical protein
MIFRLVLFSRQKAQDERWETVQCWLFADTGQMDSIVLGCPRFAEVQDACMRKCNFFFWQETYAHMSFSTCEQVHNSEENLHIVGLVQIFT